MKLRHAAILAVLCAFGGAEPRAVAQSYAVDIEALESATEELIAQRIAEARSHFAPDARTLLSDRTLDRIAHERSEAMAHGAPFAHEDETGRFAAGDKVRQRFGPNGAIGENIMMARDYSRAVDPDAFARRAVQGWMDSEGHRENILSSAYDRSGVGVAISGDYVYATQVFWGPPTLVNRGRPARRRP